MDTTATKFRQVASRRRPLVEEWWPSTHLNIPQQHTAAAVSMLEIVNFWHLKGCFLQNFNFLLFVTKSMIHIPRSITSNCPSHTVSVLQSTTRNDKPQNMNHTLRNQTSSLLFVFHTEDMSIVILMIQT